MINNTIPPLSLSARDGGAVSLPPKSSVIALGTFDGVHIAHRALIGEALMLKERIGAEMLGVFCFEESPAAIIRGERAITLTDCEEKRRLLFDCGADIVIMARFEDYRDMSAEDFISDVLISGLGALGTVCGYDHRFGKRGLGDHKMLEDTFGQSNSLTLPKMTLDGETVSSSAIREHLRLGEVENAARMLGRRISFSAAVGQGKRLGRRIGFPTANQPLPYGLSQLARGVYATLCHIEGKSYIGVSNVGVRPSIESGDDHSLNCETYLIGFDGDIYGKEMTVELCSFLRGELKFPSLDELTNAISADIERALEYFKT